MNATRTATAQRTARRPEELGPDRRDRIPRPGPNVCALRTSAPANEGIMRPMPSDPIHSPNTC